jgi:K(+)-stimulated pyrophosphate-energized sodium pump
MLISTINLYIFFPSILGILTIIFLLFKIKNKTVSDKKAIFIANAIKDGAFTFLYEEYKIIGLVALSVALLIQYFTFFVVTLSFILGAILSLVIGFIGMYAATQANLKTAMAAKLSGEHEAFKVAFYGGGVMGFSVASIGLLGFIGFLFLAISYKDSFELILTAFGFGASFVAFFARVGGGIYTKSADVGADLVGKIEAGIPEDDPRNPAVIADNVGDCVGDTAGMGADIYESYIASLISSVLLGFYKESGSVGIFTFLPLYISLIGLASSIFSFIAIRFFTLSSQNYLRFVNILAVAGVLFGSLYLIVIEGLSLSYWYVMVIGSLGGMMVGRLTEYYTGGQPVKRLAQNSESGAATNVIYGLSIGMESIVLPILLLILLVYCSFMLEGNYGVSLSAVSMLSTVAITMTVDGYGPIADNAGGIAEMSHFGKEVRTITDRLDALGNTTAAVGKGFAIGSALLAALGVFAAYAMKAQLLVLNVLDVSVLLGMFIGAVIPFLISSLTMKSVGQAALQMVFEVRRQFKEIQGLLQGEGVPDYKKCIEISTKAALSEMILPGVITVIAPFGVKFIFGTSALGGFLVGSTVVGVCLSLMMANSGGVWDNGKKYIEAGHYGGKGSTAHKAAVIGDTIGDPFKDTSGPALNILIKLMTMIALLLISL